MEQTLHSLLITHYKQLTINKVTNKKNKTLVLINDALYILKKLYNIYYQIVTS